MKKEIIFITGTDTNIGKTVATSVLAYYFQQKKIKLGVIKPIQTGQDNDIEFIRQKAELGPKQVYCPMRLKYPLAPQQAAELAKKPYINTAALVTQIKNFARNFDLTLVEGSGGLFVPIKPNYMFIDLINALKATTILVSRITLGTINHTVMSIKLLQAKKIPLYGVIYNSPQDYRNDLAAKLNPEAIREITGVTTLGIFPYQKKINIPKLTKYITMSK